MWGHTLSLSDSLRCVILKSHQPTRLPPQCNIQLLSVHRTPSAAHYWTNMSPPDIIRSAIFISWTDFLRTWIQSGEDPLNGQLWGFVIFIITSYVRIFDWKGWSGRATPIPSTIISNVIETGGAMLWIYRYIPLFSFIIYSLNYFPDIFSILLFKPCYLEATDIFPHFSH